MARDRTYLVTGGTGFIGSALVRRLVADGRRVRVLDDNSRGSHARIADVADDVEMVDGDVRDPETVRAACAGVDSVVHLAFVNGTEHFYTRPEVVLDVGVKGMVNVIDGCLAEGVGDLVVASSSEVYHEPPSIPTDESAPYIVPDPLNPRFSYAGGKMISELLAINWGRKHFDRVVVFRPHNVYGPNMGWKHVVPQFAERMFALRDETSPVAFPIQGTGEETRAFNFIDDFTDGLVRVIDRGEHLGIYHIGSMDEVSIADVAREVARCFGREITIEPGELAAGGTPRRCPDITKLRGLGYEPRVGLREGIERTVAWYAEALAQRDEQAA